MFDNILNHIHHNNYYQLAQRIQVSSSWVKQLLPSPSIPFQLGCCYAARARFQVVRWGVASWGQRCILKADGCGRQGFSRLRHTRDAVVVTERSGNQDVVDASQGVRDSSSQLSSSSDLHIIIKITKIINRGKLVCAPWHVAKGLIIHVATLGLCLC